MKILEKGAVLCRYQYVEILVCLGHVAEWRKESQDQHDLSLVLNNVFDHFTFSIARGFDLEQVNVLGIAVDDQNSLIDNEVDQRKKQVVESSLEDTALRMFKAFL